MPERLKKNMKNLEHDNVSQLAQNYATSQIQPRSFPACANLFGVLESIWIWKLRETKFQTGGYVTVALQS